MKFDDGQVEQHSASRPSSGRSDLIFLHPYGKIVPKLRRAKHLMIEAELIPQGKQQMDFEVAELEWN